MLAPHLPPCLPASILPSKTVQSRAGPAGQMAGSQRPARFGAHCSCSALPPCSMRGALHHFRDARHPVKVRTRTPREDSAGRSGCLVECWAWWGHEGSGTTSRQDRPTHHPGATRSVPESHVERCGRGGRSGGGWPPRGTFTHTTTYHVLHEALRLLHIIFTKEEAELKDNTLEKPQN